MNRGPPGEKLVNALANIILYRWGVIREKAARASKRSRGSHGARGGYDVKGPRNAEFYSATFLSVPHPKSPKYDAASGFRLSPALRPGARAPREAGHETFFHREPRFVGQS